MTSILTLEKRKAAFERLGSFMRDPDEALKQLIHSAQHYNSWFTPEQTLQAVTSIGDMLNSADIAKWMDFESGKVEPKRVGLVLAGNIPLVGFHDILSVLAAGHSALIKLSSQDKHLTPHLLKKLTEFEPGYKEHIIFVEKLEGFDAVVATGSNNTARYFEYYFGKVPHIIRKNRNSVAVLTSDETSEQLQRLGRDIFSYYGLGCRNVSKLYVPKGYNFRSFFEAIEQFKDVLDHHKYNNNYDYNKSILLVNGEQHLDNGFLLVKEDVKLASPLAVLYYQEYESIEKLTQELQTLTEQIQCIAGSIPLNIAAQQVGFGETQQPRLWDYADGVDTLKFLLSL